MPWLYKWSYIFGAACPARGTAAGLILPRVDAEAMSLHLQEIAKTVATGAHALLKLPAYAPELNPMENVWAYLRANKLAITVFDSHEDILDKCEDAWNFFENDPERISSIINREWASVN
jgi:transposase